MRVWKGSNHLQMFDIKTGEQNNARIPHFTVLLTHSIHCSRGGMFLFDFNISASYPHEAPKVLCKTKVQGVQGVQEVQRVQGVQDVQGVSCRSL